MKLKKRHRLRQKEVQHMADALRAVYGCDTFTSSDHVDRATAPTFDVLILEGSPVAIIIEEVPVLTVKGLMRYKAKKAYVEVDMGAIPYVTNGADIMSPGIVAADDVIEVGGPVWIRDERNKRPLAVGQALMTGKEMVSSKKGKAVKTVHYYGDELWGVEP